MGRRIRWIPPGGALVEITTTTLQRRHLLQPTPAVREIVLGVLGRAQRLYPLEIHAFCFLSSHYHLLATVVDAERLAAFCRYLNSNLAREVARETGWREKVWGRRYVSIHVTDEEAAQVGRLRYVLSQGVKEGLIDHPESWPGAHAVGALLRGESLEGLWFNRTREYNARMGGKPWHSRMFAEPERVELAPLPCWREVPEERRQERVAELIESIREEARAEGRLEAVPSPSKLARLLTKTVGEPPPRPHKRSPAPLVHAATKAARKRFYQTYCSFLAAYRAAVEQLRNGELTAPFPDGCFPPARAFIGAT